MKNLTGIVTGLVLILIVAGMFIFTYLKKQELQNSDSRPSQGVEENDSPYASIKRIDAKHFYIDGKHTVVGEIDMPTPCDLLNWDAQVSKTAPEQVLLDFKIVNHTKTCEQVLTQQRFKVDFNAAENAVVTAKIQGNKVELNLIPPAPGETPESYELFLKG